MFLCGSLTDLNISVFELQFSDYYKSKKQMEYFSLITIFPGQSLHSQSLVNSNSCSKPVSEGPVNEINVQVCFSSNLIVYIYFYNDSTSFTSCTLSYCLLGETCAIFVPKKLQVRISGLTVTIHIYIYMRETICDTFAVLLIKDKGSVPIHCSKNSIYGIRTTQ